MNNLFQEIAIKNKKPIICNLKSGHCIRMVSIPLNMMCQMKLVNEERKIIRK